MDNWFFNLRQHLKSTNFVDINQELCERLHGKITIGGKTTKNLITNAGIRVLAQALSNPQQIIGKNIVPTFQIYKFGASTSDSIPVPEDVSLGGTTSSRVVEQVDSMGAKLIVTNFVGQPEMNFNWKKVGLYLANGVLFAVALVDEPKTDQVAKTVVWEIELS